MRSHIVYFGGHGQMKWAIVLEVGGWGLEQMVQLGDAWWLGMNSLGFLDKAFSCEEDGTRWCEKGAEYRDIRNSSIVLVKEDEED